MYKTFNRKIGYITIQNCRKTPCNKLCVDLIGPYKIRRNGKEPLILKSVTMIDPVTGWFEVTQYSDKKAMVISKLGRNYVAGPVSMASRDHL